MTLAFSVPPPTRSPLSAWDPRWKGAALLIAAAVAAVLHTLPAAAAGLAAALLLAVVARLPVGWFGRRLGGFALVLALFALPLPWLLRDDGPAWDLGAFRLSVRGATAALVLSAKAVTIATLALVAQATAPLEDNLKAAHALRVPGLLVQLALLTYRYLFVLADELARLRVALRVRGYRHRMRPHCYRTAGHVAGTLLVRGYERAERVGHAMRCRGFDGRFRSLSAYRSRRADVLTFLAIAGCALALGAWDWLPRFAG